MISKITLGSGVSLENIHEVFELVETGGGGIRRNLSINLRDEESTPSLSEIEAIFASAEDISPVEIYKRDAIEGTDSPQEFGEEYLSETLTLYSGVVSLYRCMDSKRISINLTTDPSDLADEKYQELVEKNNMKQQEINSLNGAIMELSSIIAILQIGGN